MAIEPVPVTFHMRAEPGEAPRRRIRPYASVVQAVGVVAFMGVLFGFMAGGFAPAPKGSVASSPAPAPAREAQARPQAQSQAQSQRADVASAPAPGAFVAPARAAQQAQVPAPVRQTEAANAGGGDPTPVATIAGSGPRARGFAPGERAPDYSGFRVVAGR